MIAALNTPWQQRVGDELIQLEARIEKLGVFISQRAIVCEQAEVDRLAKQLIIMRQYADVLRERIENFK